MYNKVIRPTRYCSDLPTGKNLDYCAFDIPRPSFVGKGLPEDQTTTPVGKAKTGLSDTSTQFLRLGSNFVCIGICF